MERVANVVTGVAIDLQDGDISSHIEWYDAGDILIATGSFFDTQPLAAGVHSITARVRDSDAFSAEANFVLTVIPAAPTGLVATVSLSGVTLRWLDNSRGETAYVIQRTEKPTGKKMTPNWQNIATLPADSTSYFDSRFTSGDYLYRVIAVYDEVLDPDYVDAIFSNYSNEVAVSL